MQNIYYTENCKWNVYKLFLPKHQMDVLESTSGGKRVFYDKSFFVQGTTYICDKHWQRI